MKKVLVLLLTLAICFAFTACSEKTKSSSDADKPTESIVYPTLIDPIVEETLAVHSSVDLNSVMQAVNTEFDFSEATVEGLTVIDSYDKLELYYLIKEQDIYQFAAERTSAAKEVFEVVMVEARGMNEAGQIAVQLNSRLDAQKSTARSYNPELSYIYDQAEVAVSGNFVYLVINERSGEINSLIESMLNT